MIYVFLNDYFSQDRGMSVETATGALVVFGVGGFLGQAIGKFLIWSFFVPQIFTS